MKKKLIFGILIFIILAIVLFFLFGDKLAIAIISGKIHPREPRNQVEITNNIGWWSYQNNLHIDSFNVEIIENKLNLFNSYSLLEYNIKGKLVGKNNWKPFIDKVHISERFIREYNRELHPYLDTDTSRIPEAIFEITPIVKVKEDKSYKGEAITFDIKNELKVQSFHWGNNWLRLACDSLKVDLTLKQMK